MASTAINRSAIPLTVWPKSRSRDLRRSIQLDLARAPGSPSPQVLDLRSNQPATVDGLRAQLESAICHVRPNGHLAVIVETKIDPNVADSIGTTIKLCAQAGLRYLQHIVVLDCELADFPAPNELSPHHRRAHTDVLIFANHAALAAGNN